MNKKKSRLSDLWSLLLYKPQSAGADREKARSFAATRTMLSSVLCMSICAICLCGATWAWFTGTASVDITTITSHKWEPEISVTVCDAAAGEGTSVTSLENADSIDAVAEGQQPGAQEKAADSVDTDGQQAEEKTEGGEQDTPKDEGKQLENDSETQQGEEKDKDIQEQEPEQESQITAASADNITPTLMLLSAQTDEEIILASDPSISNGESKKESAADIEAASEQSSGEAKHEVQSTQELTPESEGKDKWDGWTYTLNENTAYMVKLNISGTEGATGYFKVDVQNNKTYYTPDIVLGTDGQSLFTFAVAYTSTATMTITPVWGTCADRVDSEGAERYNAINEGGSIGDYTPAADTAAAASLESGEKKPETAEPASTDSQQNGVDAQQSGTDAQTGNGGDNSEDKTAADDNTASSDNAEGGITGGTTDETGTAAGDGTSDGAAAEEGTSPKAEQNTEDAVGEGDAGTGDTGDTVGDDTLAEGDGEDNRDTGDGASSQSGGGEEQKPEKTSDGTPDTGPKADEPQKKNEVVADEDEGDGEEPTGVTVNL